METCQSCGIKHPSVDAIGIWYCPNALCRGAGAAWFRKTLDSYQEYEDFTHSVEENEWQEKGKAYMDTMPLPKLPEVK